MMFIEGAKINSNKTTMFKFIFASFLFAFKHNADVI